MCTNTMVVRTCLHRVLTASRVSGDAYRATCAGRRRFAAASCWANTPTSKPASRSAAAFLTAAARHLNGLGVTPTTGQLAGVELHAESTATAQAAVAELGWPAELTTGDFFTVTPSRSFEAVIGNPPYVRYQDFSGANRVRARAAALAAGVPLTALASSWAAFTVHAAQFLKPGGRLGLVLPAELLSVNYAAGVRRFLMESFGRVRLVVFTERVFPGVQEEVVLLLAQDAWAEGGTDVCELRQVREAADLEALVDNEATQLASRWTPQPLPHKAKRLRRVRDHLPRQHHATGSRSPSRG